MADSTITVAFEADTSDLQAGVAEAQEAIGSFQPATNAAASALSGLFGIMETASNTALKGILLGTQTWQKALENTFAGLLASFINDCVIQRVLGWVSAEATMTAATEAGDAERLASNEAASSGSIASQASRAVSAIMSDASQVFGGIFAFLAPELGPAAAAPAEAGSAAVAAMASGITYAENGAWNIPSNTLAYLHAGEMVVPQSFAASMRDGALGGSGGNYTININAIDTQTGAQFLKNNASSIASALNAQSRNFNRNAPGWKA
jgi:hypothetical protein